MRATHYLENKILNTFRGITAAAPTDLYVGLFHTSPANTGTAGAELAYPGYQRRKVTFTAPERVVVKDAITGADVITNDVIVKNDSRIDWAISDAELGEIRYIGIFDSPILGNGNMLLYGELIIPLRVYANQQPSFAPERLRYYISGDFSVYMKTKTMNILRGEQILGFTPYLALFDADPEIAGNEFSGGTYERLELEFDAPLIQSDDKTQISNKDESMFEPPGEDETWGLYAYDGLMDAKTGGNLIVKHPAAVVEILLDSYVPVVPAGQFKISLD